MSHFFKVPCGFLLKGVEGTVSQMRRGIWRLRGPSLFSSDLVVPLSWRLGPGPPESGGDGFGGVNTRPRSPPPPKWSSLGAKRWPPSRASSASGAFSWKQPPSKEPSLCSRQIQRLHRGQSNRRLEGADEDAAETGKEGAMLSGKRQTRRGGQPRPPGAQAPCPHSLCDPGKPFSTQGPPQGQLEGGFQTP